MEYEEGRTSGERNLPAKYLNRWAPETIKLVTIYGQVTRYGRSRNPPRRESTRTKQRRSGSLNLGGHGRVTKSTCMGCGVPSSAIRVGATPLTLPPLRRTCSVRKITGTLFRPTQWLLFNRPVDCLLGLTNWASTCRIVKREASFWDLCGSIPDGWPGPYRSHAVNHANNKGENAH